MSNIFTIFTSVASLLLLRPHETLFIFAVTIRSIAITAVVSMTRCGRPAGEEKIKNGDHSLLQVIIARNTSARAETTPAARESGCESLGNRHETRADLHNHERDERLGRVLRVQIRAQTHADTPEVFHSFTQFDCRDAAAAAGCQRVIKSYTLSFCCVPRLLSMCCVRVPVAV